MEVYLGLIEVVNVSLRDDISFAGSFNAQIS